jgi:hypothetical protein
MYEMICWNLVVGYVSGLVHGLGFTTWPHPMIPQL